MLTSIESNNIKYNIKSKTDNLKKYLLSKRDNSN